MDVLSPCVRVAFERAEETRGRLAQLGALRTDLRIRREAGHVLLPVREEARELFLGYPFSTADFEERIPRGSYKDRAKIPDALRSLLPTSFDVVGDILIIKLPDELLAHARPIGEALLGANRAVRVVALDRGVKETFRVRDLEVIAGEKRLVTIHHEHGCRFRVDLGRTYFSPRLATERLRVANAVKPGEIVLDLFAGVGPFSIVIAKHARPQRVYAIDANPDALALLQENVLLNRVPSVVPILGDAAAVATQLPARADRIIMNLPHGAAAYISAALSAAADEAILHYHTIEAEDAIEDHAAKRKAESATLGWSLSASQIRVVRNYSPGSRHFAIDFYARKTGEKQGKPG